ncbi:MAG TPA: TonB-dependent receptor [Gemmatimonadaceae bacterium]|nr:TonB-dependent receptor [Gemmatimonadaceae bacterium]
MSSCKAGGAWRLRGRIVQCSFVALSVFASRESSAQTDSTRRDTTRLATVTIIGSRSDLAEERDKVLRVPGGVTVLRATELRATRQANLYDVLRFTPGVYIQPRFGSADESQISVRGSGLRNNFHARGINLLVNGMPYRNADGFTDFESLELLTTEGIDVYKGANALRYGGATLGGAINLHTQTGYTASPFSAFLQGGSNGFAKGQLATAGVNGGLDWYGSFAHTQTEGYRTWSDQRRDRVNLHAGYRLNRASDLRTFYFAARVSEHLPGALTRAELESTPQGATPANVTNKWGRDYDLHHVGIQYRAQLTPTQRIEVSPYLQYRDIDHPIFEVISQISQDWGAEIRYENSAGVLGKGNHLTIGVQPALGNVQNKQYQNVAGKHGNLTRDEHDRATTVALYAENALDVTDRVSAIAGLRLERATRGVDDYFLSNGDQSDRRTFDAFSPRVGLLGRVSDRTQVFANASRTVEPPLMLELSSFGNAGGFIPLRAQSAWQYEVGARTQRLGINWDVSLYDIELRNELLNINVQPFPGAPFTVPSYRNATRTRHAGVEAGVAFQRWIGLFSRGDVRDAVSGRVSYAYNRFTFTEDSAFSGKELPGAPRQYVSAEVKYRHPSGFSIAPSVELVPEAYFLDSPNTVTNSAWSSVGLRAEWTLERFGATAFAAANNLTNRRYSGSVQVDNAAGRYFEPADARSIYVGLRLAR